MIDKQELKGWRVVEVYTNTPVEPADEGDVNCRFCQDTKIYELGPMGMQMMSLDPCPYCSCAEV